MNAELAERLPSQKVQADEETYYATIGQFCSIRCSIQPLND